VTEAEWLACVDPDLMLDFLQGRASDRKLGLFAAACARMAWHLLEDVRSRRAIEVGEGYLEGVASEASLVAATRRAYAATSEMSPRRQSGRDARERAAYESQSNAALAAAKVLPDDRFPFTNATSKAREVARYATLAIEYESVANTGWRRPARERVRAEQCVLLREVFGNPHRPVVLDPSWLTPTVARLAEGIYVERVFDRLPYLGDALEQEGLTAEEVLEHCRSGAQHVRGCYVLDLILGRS
jgi:hypothetical protein